MLKTANAGSDQTIYLTVQNNVTLTGSGTGTSITYQWTKVSADQTDGATIGSPPPANIGTQTVYSGNPPVVLLSN